MPEHLVGVLPFYPAFADLLCLLVVVGGGIVLCDDDLSEFGVFHCEHAETGDIFCAGEIVWVGETVWTRPVGSAESYFLREKVHFMEVYSNCIFILVDDLCECLTVVNALFL